MSSEHSDKIDAKRALSKWEYLGDMSADKKAWMSQYVNKHRIYEPKHLSSSIQDLKNFTPDFGELEHPVREYPKSEMTDRICPLTNTPIWKLGKDNSWDVDKYVSDCGEIIWFHKEDKWITSFDEHKKYFQEVPIDDERIEIKELVRLFTNHLYVQPDRPSKFLGILLKDTWRKVKTFFGAKDVEYSFENSHDFNIFTYDLVSSPGFPILPIAKKISAKTLGLDLVPVAPLSLPSGQLMYVDYQYETPEETPYYGNSNTPNLDVIDEAPDKFIR